MDHYGIGHAMQCMAHVYSHSARRTGRTTSMLESLKSGDRVVFVEPREAARIHRLCKERGLEVDCIVLPAEHPHRLFERGTSTGRTLLDHAWVERYYLLSLEQCQKDIDRLQRESSGFGEAHLETRQLAPHILDWKG